MAGHVIAEDEVKQAKEAKDSGKGASVEPADTKCPKCGKGALVRYCVDGRCFYPALGSDCPWCEAERLRGAVVHRFCIPCGYRWNEKRSE